MIDETRDRISAEYMAHYYEWLHDEAEMSDSDYGRKYGWGKGEIRHTDCLASLKVYNRYWGWGAYLPRLKRQGFDSHELWELRKEGFLSYKAYSSWRACQLHETDWFFISERTAVQIYKARKGGK